MLDELAVIPASKLQQEIDRQRNERNDGWFNRLRNADAETLAGYITFGGGAVEKANEPESTLPF